MYHPIIIPQLGGLSRAALVVFTGLTCAWLSSCETVAGFGQDVENAGDSIEHAAYDASP